MRKRNYSTRPGRARLRRAVTGFLSLFIIPNSQFLILFLLAAPAAAQAQFSWTTNAGGVTLTVTGYSGPGGNIAIPAAISNLTVTAIGQFAFDNNTSLTGVAIPGTSPPSAKARFSTAPTSAASPFLAVSLPSATMLLIAASA